MQQGSKSNEPANNIGLLRLVLAIMVIFSHSFALIDGDRSREWLFRLSHGDTDFGSIAVDCFFILSGFLLLQSWIRKPKAGPFLMRRALRIYPGFLVAYAVSALIVGRLGAQPGSDYFHSLSWSRFVGRALLLRPPATPDVFLPQPYPVVNGSLWTIPYEAVCYWLLLVVGLTGIARRPALLFGLFAVAYLALAAQHIGVLHVPGNETALIPALYHFPRFVTYFLAGACAARLKLDGRLLYQMPYLLVALVTAGISLLLGHSDYVLPISGAYLLLWTAEGLRPAPFMKGDLSYGIYLYAWPVQKLLLFYVHGFTPLLLFPAALLCTLPPAALSWYLIESPAQQLGRARKPIPARVVAGS